MIIPFDEWPENVQLEFVIDYPTYDTSTTKLIEVISDDINKNMFWLIDGVPYLCSVSIFKSLQKPNDSLRRLFNRHNSVSSSYIAYTEIVAVNIKHGQWKIIYAEETDPI